MSMLQTFFEIGCDKTLFDGLKISEECEAVWKAGAWDRNLEVSLRM